VCVERRCARTQAGNLTRKPEVSMRRLLAILAPVALACAPAAQNTAVQSGPATEPAMASSNAGLLGSYRVSLTDQELAALPENMRAGVMGNWMITLHEGNHFVVSRDGTEGVQGTYRLNGNQLVLDPGETGTYACPSGAIYTWRMSSGLLTLTPVGTDSCAGRAALLTSHPLTRNP
jgi:hypothetical protein